jgi:small conductance mechanosensitive channel
MDAEFLVSLVVNGAVALGIGVVGYFLSIVAARVVRAIAGRWLDKGLAGFLGSLARVAVLILTLQLTVDQTGAAGLLVILVTAFTGALALGSERIAGDLVAGANLFMLNYYKVGDLVTIDEHQGRIQAVSLTHTSLDNNERDRIIIPNSEILSQVIVNHTAVPGARLKAEVQVLGRHDRGQVMERILEAAKSFEPQLRGPNDKPSVILSAVEHSEEGLVSTYVARVYAPENLYGEDHRLLLHIRHVLDAQEVDEESEVALDLD